MYRKGAGLMPRVHNRNKPIHPIRDCLVWSRKCREHFLPWRSAAAKPFQDNYIAEAGISDLHPGYDLGRTNPRFHLLLFTTLGKGTLYTPSYSKTIEGATVLIVPAHVPFGYKPQGGRWRFLWYHLREREEWRRIESGDATIRRTFLTGFLESATDGFLKESRRHDTTSHRAAELYAELIVLYIQRELGGQSDVGDRSIKQQLYGLWDAVNKDLKRAWTVENLAEGLGMSASHFHRICRQQAGVPPMRMVTRLRMERAQELLILYDDPVRVIAEMVGYRNEFAFFTAFRRFSGVTPRQFRTRR
jgi:AraC-like DNA-binding protein